MLTYLAVGIGGAAGSCLRYAITMCFSLATFPYGTLLSNTLAGGLIGFILEFDRHCGFFSPNMRLLLTTGLMGGLSTFSTFSVETLTFFQAGKIGTGLWNILLNLVLSFGGVLLGVLLVRLFFTKAV